MTIQLESRGGKHSCPLPTAAYIHIPFCRQRCFYCDFPITPVGPHQLNLDGWVGEYVEAVCQEIQAQQTTGNILETIFFGGGTPSLLPIAGLEKILTTVREHFQVDNAAEISIEIDPGTFDQEQLQAYVNLGINRFSLGIQAFQDHLLTVCGRHHRRLDIDLALTAIDNVGVKNWSLDLITGLPEQTNGDWKNSLALALEANPKHISCYDLVLESQTVFDKREKQGNLSLPPSEQSANFYRQAQQILTQAGFDHYEISNYAQPHYRCRHNQIYWRNLPYYGLGMGATSYIDGRRFSRPRTRNSYYQWLQEWLAAGATYPGEGVSPTEQLLESLMLGLRLTAGVTLDQLPFIDEVEKRKILDILKPFVKRHWVSIYDFQHRNLDLTNLDINFVKGFYLLDPEGILYSNQILSSLFAALEDN